MLRHDPLTETFLPALLNYNLDLQLLRLQIFSSLFVPLPSFFTLVGH